MRAPTVVMRLMRRKDGSEFIEICVSSDRTYKGPYNRPQMRSVIERNFAATAKIEVLAGALAEDLCEKYGATLDPSEVARTAAEVYRQIVKDNPKPTESDPEPF